MTNQILPSKRGRGRPKKGEEVDKLFTPKRPRGRPKKIQSSDFPVDDIERPNIEDHVLSHGFRGSANVKRIGEEIEWTTERISEFAKCSLDPIYFIETYMRIVHVDRGLVPFLLYDYQKEMVLSMFHNRNTIITTARQIGKSTCTCGFILWYILFNKSKTVGLLANKGDTAREIMGKVLLAYEHLPKWLQQGVSEMNKGSLMLENGSRVLATATSGTAIRGYALNLLFIDEAAFIENWDDFFTAVFPTISSGTTTKIVLVSTPNGLNHYYKLWVNSVEKRNNYNAIKVTWDKVPGRDAKWKQETLANLNFDADKFAQENEAEFLGSSGTLISGRALGELVHQTPIAEHGNLTMYKRPVEENKYAIVVDVSKGRGLDYSAFSVIDVTAMPYEQVCVFRSNTTTPADYANIVYLNAKSYNDAVILVELNSIGETVSNILYDEYEYEGLLFTESAGRAGKQISIGAPTSKVDKGIVTSIAVKAKGCSMLKMLVEQKQLIVNDFNTIQELSTFSKKNKSYEAEPGATDDLVMGLVLFAWLSDQRYFKDLTDINTLQSLRDDTAESLLSSMIGTFGMIINAADDFYPETESIVDAMKRSVFVDGAAFDQILFGGGTKQKDDLDLERAFNKLFE